jgi:hypothetical protein
MDLTPLGVLAVVVVESLADHSLNLSTQILTGVDSLVLALILDTEQTEEFKALHQLTAKAE